MSLQKQSLHLSPDTSNRQCDIVMFDLGGVLIRIVSGVSEACEAAGIEVRSDPLSGKSARELVAASNALEVGEIEVDDFVNLMAKRTDFSIAEVRRIVDVWCLDMQDGAEELLVNLENAGIQAGCLSNTNARHWEFLDNQAGAFAPLQRLDFRYASHLIGARKPDDRPYQYVEEQTGLSGNAILFFDDKQENLDAAARRGWRVAHVHQDFDKAGTAVEQIRKSLIMHGIEIT